MSFVFLLGAKEQLLWLVQEPRLREHQPHFTIRASVLLCSKLFGRVAVHRRADLDVAVGCAGSPEGGHRRNEGVAGPGYPENGMAPHTSLMSVLQYSYLAECYQTQSRRVLIRVPAGKGGTPSSCVCNSTAYCLVVLFGACQLEPAKISGMDFREFCAATVNVFQLEIQPNWAERARLAYQNFLKSGKANATIDDLIKACSTHCTAVPLCGSVTVSPAHVS